MEDVGKKCRFNKELPGRRGSYNQRPTVEGTPVQPQPPRFDEIDSSDLVALPEQRLISRERAPFKRLLVQCQHAPSRPSAISRPENASTECHRESCLHSL